MFSVRVAFSLHFVFYLIFYISALVTNKRVHYSVSGSLIKFIYLFKHQRQRAQATYMPVKSSTMNIYK